jgi:hypothetical protein
MPTKKLALALLAAGILIQCVITFRLVRVLLRQELQTASDAPAAAYVAISLVGLVVAVRGAHLLRKQG